MDVGRRPVSADWRNLNLANWESRVGLHTGPDGYDLGSFDDPAFLSGEVRYDLPKLGRLDGLDIVHLQCHIGTDTVSLSRLGPRSTVGLDFSPAALRAARELAVRARADIGFVEADVYDGVQALGADRFDLVFTGIGALCWIPSIGRWADVVAGLLRPGGRLFMREYHPVLWSLSDPRPDGLLVVEYPYFETDGTLCVMPPWLPRDLGVRRRARGDLIDAGICWGEITPARRTCSWCAATIAPRAPLPMVSVP
jgi:SAM-dependent methyltransferase